MHISEGVLSAPVLVTGALLAAGGVAIGLKKMDYEKIPEVAVLSSAFFVASLIHVPIGPSSVHLILNGLLGILLGWMAFPSILVALTLHAVLFQFGGLTSLGVNTVTMATPGVIAYYFFNLPIRKGNNIVSAVSGFAAGVTGVGIGAILVAIALISTGESFLGVAKLIVVAHIPVMVIEGIITAFCVIFLKKVKPEILEVGK
ncbi:MAG TPA: cobalt transporter CbiM [Nitrospirae bacterium]|nr:fused nickel transport protein NikMN [bacterium BMS3Abin08]HDO36945.1 cobalt transporter CbiM [Nitrospirota bacterium]